MGLGDTRRVVRQNDPTMVVELWVGRGHRKRLSREDVVRRLFPRNLASRPSLASSHTGAEAAVMGLGRDNLVKATQIDGPFRASQVLSFAYL